MRLLLCVLVVAVLAGCGTETTRPQTTGSDPPEPDAYTDLPGYEGDPFAGFAEVVSIDLPAPSADGAEDPGDEGTATTAGPFSIQIMALGDEATARGVAESASDASGLESHVDHEGGYWKVRLGSFSDRASASAKLAEMAELGFFDAWVVRRGGD